MTLSEIRLRLNELGVRPSRRLGQNFLHDQNVARRIVEEAGIQPEDSVMEIGPGLGAITEFIPEQTDKLTLIEKDRRLAAFLRGRFPQAHLIEADAMEEISNLKSPISNSIVLGNLPYSIASPLIVRLCEADLRPRRMLFTIQLEVAERLVAGPQTKDFGLLTLLTQAFYQIKMTRKVPPSVFWPRPEVASAVVRMERREAPLFSDADAESRFRARVKQAFQKRRKTLGAIFGREWPDAKHRTRRPEELSVEEWVALSQSEQPAAVEEWFDVVNERDEVTGRERRSEVHRRNLVHRAIHIFLWNSNGDLLLQKRSAEKDVAPNTWDSSAAGHLGVGEDYDAAAEREVVEELGVSPKLSRVRKFEACQELGWEFVWLYEGKSDGPFQFPKCEISEVRWWTPAGITDALKKDPHHFAPSFRWIWESRPP